MSMISNTRELGFLMYTRCLRARHSLHKNHNTRWYGYSLGEAEASPPPPSGRGNALICRSMWRPHKLAAMIIDALIVVESFALALLFRFAGKVPGLVCLSTRVEGPSAP